MITTVSVPVSASGDVVVAENAVGEQGGQVWLRNTGSNALLIGGRNGMCEWPLETTDEPFGPLEVRQNDVITAQISGAVAASLNTGVIVNNNAITWTAVTKGAGGNSVTVTLVDPGANNAALAVVVTGNAIVVNLATGAGGAITSTAAQVIAAVNAAQAFCIASNDGASTGAAAVVAVGLTNLSGGVGIAGSLAVLLESR